MPVDTAGKTATNSANKPPRALISPLIELLESITARRLRAMLEGNMSASQYAYKTAGGTEELMSDLDQFVSTNRRTGRAP